MQHSQPLAPMSRPAMKLRCASYRQNTSDKSYLRLTKFNSIIRQILPLSGKRHSCNVDFLSDLVPHNCLQYVMATARRCVQCHSSKRSIRFSSRRSNAIVALLRIARNEGAAIIGVDKISGHASIIGLPSPSANLTPKIWFRTTPRSLRVRKSPPRRGRAG